MPAGRAMKNRGGVLELTNRQPAVARLLSLMGVDQTITIQAAAAGSHAEGAGCDQPPGGTPANGT